MRKLIPVAVLFSLVFAVWPSGEDTRIKGLWLKSAPASSDDQLRFYYFHGEHGLYRYGQVGLNNTNSYDYTAQDGKLAFQFRKTGEKAEARYSFEEKAGRQWLVLNNDPREPKTSRYFKVPDDVAAAVLQRTGPTDLGAAQVATTQLDQEPPPPAQKPGWDRLWMNVEKYKTGGMGFQLYQFYPPALDGRGVGWHHIGDFDNWSTEALNYRIFGDQVEIAFTVRGDVTTTRFKVQAADKRRALSFEDDPRNYHQRSRFIDAGKTF